MLSNRWVIIGANSVGSMTAALLTTLFPEQEIHVFDKPNVRESGFGIRVETIKEMKAVLQTAKERTEEIIVRSVSSKEQLEILKGISELTKVLDDCIDRQFDRKFNDREFIQDFCKKRSHDFVHFHLDSEITADDLNVLTDEFPHPLNEKQEILKQADIIFGADNSHGGIRKIIFNEILDGLHKEVLNYLLEIKLETVTHYIYINEAIYRQLRGNTYRRLIEFPDDLKDELEKLIVNLMSENKIHASLFEITALPMHAYDARQLVRKVGEKRIILLGNSSLDLVLAENINSGFYMASVYAAFIYNEGLHNFDKHQCFLDEQYENLQRLFHAESAKLELKVLDVANKDNQKSSFYYTDEMAEVRAALQELHVTISQYDLTANPEYKNFVFLMDRLYLNIERTVGKTVINQYISAYINNISSVTMFFINLPALGAQASEQFMKFCSFDADGLAKRLVDLGNYLFNEARKVANLSNDVIFNLALGAIQNYPEHRKHDISWSEKWTWLHNIEEAQAFEHHLIEEANPVARLVLLYALIRYCDLEYLKPVVYKQILSTEKTPTPLNIQVLSKVLQNKILESANASDFIIFDNIACAISSAIKGNKELVSEELNNLNGILEKAKNVEKRDVGKIISTAPMYLLSSYQKKSGLFSNRHVDDSKLKNGRDTAYKTFKL